MKTLKTIAIIEDDVHIGDIIEESLHREGYQTCRAYSGTEAQYLLADDRTDKKPDLILLDLMLPGMTGEELLSRIQDIPVIVISAKVGIDDKVDVLLGGAADYITKPFAIRELLARVAVQLRKREKTVDTRKEQDTQKQEELTAGELKLDLVMRIISAGDDSVRLTRTEFAILRLLMQNAGQVFSKSAILDHISGDTPDCTDSSLKQHISNLRKKLQDIGKNDCIEAVWGIGFRFSI
ncbi:MAG: response regulator transcription factor [Lachnospiraceae bacterium]|nr:response regulator transcription factor [Lachnospiraceae bacterium]MDE7200361.1 response regulator transcription factor [Lachnospiraceae bacterium]